MLAAAKVFAAFAAFCAMASACYVLNDIADRERDRRHPEKSSRPIASGALSLGAAVLLALALAAVALVLGTAVTPGLAACLVGYALLNVAYSTSLKHAVIADVFCIALGFVLRVVAGSLASTSPQRPGSS